MNNLVSVGRWVKFLIEIGVLLDLNRVLKQNRVANSCYNQGTNKIQSKPLLDHFFNGKLLARLANVETIPEPKLLNESSHEYSILTNEELLQESAKLLETNNIKDAWQIVHIFLSRVNN